MSVLVFVFRRCLLRCQTLLKPLKHSPKKTKKVFNEEVPEGFARETDAPICSLGLHMIQEYEEDQRRGWLRSPWRKTDPRLAERKRFHA